MARDIPDGAAETGVQLYDCVAFCVSNYYPKSAFPKLLTKLHISPCKLELMLVCLCVCLRFYGPFNTINVMLGR